MFSLAIYDTLTPGSLTDGEIIAGTGELADDGSVGPIGGIEQKIAGAEDAGAELFFVPKDNCADVEGSRHRPDPGQGDHDAPGARLARGVGRRPRRRAAELLRETLMDFELEIDPALAAAVLEIEKHHADAGWDQPARLYALVDTAALVAHEPALASALGLDESRERGSLTPVEQEAVTAGQELEEFLPSISWPPGWSGAPPSSSGWCCRRPPTARSRTTRRRRWSSPASTPTGRRSGSWPA